MHDMSPPPPPKARRSDSEADKNDKMYMILERLGRNTETMNTNLERLHKEKETLDIEIEVNKRLDDVDKKLHKVKKDAADANAARRQSREPGGGARHGRSRSRRGLAATPAQHGRHRRLASGH